MEGEPVGDRRKSPVGTFPPKHPHCPHSLPAKPSVRTVVRIEVFFAPAKLGQKMDFKSPLRGQIKVFRQAEPDFEMKSGFVFFVTKRNIIY